MTFGVVFKDINYLLNLIDGLMHEHRLLERW